MAAKTHIEIDDPIVSLIDSKFRSLRQLTLWAIGLTVGVVTAIMNAVIGDISGVKDKMMRHTGDTVIHRTQREMQLEAENRRAFENSVKFQLQQISETLETIRDNRRHKK